MSTARTLCTGPHSLPPQGSQHRQLPSTVLGLFGIRRQKVSKLRGMESSECFTEAHRAQNNIVQTTKPAGSELTPRPATRQSHVDPAQELLPVSPTSPSACELVGVALETQSSALSQQRTGQAQRSAQCNQEAKRAVPTFVPTAMSGTMLWREKRDVSKVCSQGQRPAGPARKLGGAGK